jgi:hypothetical protein
MARKSPWQEFAENFKGVYGTFKQIGQDVETSRIMDDERFTGEGGLGAGLKGSALDKARYKALGDIYTKYGNAKEGLAMRQSVSDLESSERKNELDAATLQERIKQNGLLQSLLMNSQANSNNASAALSFGRANTEDALRDGRVEGQRLTNLGLGIGNDTSKLAYDMGVATQPDAIAATNASNQSIVNQAPSADAAAIAANQSIVNQAPSADAAAIAQSNLLSAQATNNLTLEDLRTDAGAEAYRTQIIQAYENQNQARINELQTLGFLDYAERFSEGEFENPEQAKDAYLGVIAQFDPTKAMELAKKYSADEIGALANQGVKLQTEMNKILQKPGETALREAAKYFDEQNGEDTGVTFRKTDNGYEMFETANGENVGTVFENLSLEEAKSALQGLTTYGNATNYAEKLYARKVSEAGLKKTEAETENIESKTEYQGILNDTTRYSTLLKNDNVEAQTALANAQVEKLKQDTEAEEGLDYSDKMAIKAFNNFLGGTTYGALAQDLDAAQLRVYTNRVKMGLGLLSQPPSGVDEDVWLAMSEADQALFN